MKHGDFPVHYVNVYHRVTGMITDYPSYDVVPQFVNAKLVNISPMSLWFLLDKEL